MTTFPALWARFRWETRRFAAWFGVPGITAFALALATASVLIQAGILQHEAARLREQLTHQSHKPAPLPRPVAPEVAAMNDFYDQLPPAAALPSLVEQLLSEGARAGVNLESGSYHVEDTGLGFIRYQIVLPVEGDNPRILGFVWRAMTAMPTLALESLNFQRDTAGAVQGRAEIRFILFVRSGLKDPLRRGSGS